MTQFMIPAEVRERITSTADELYEQADREAFPIVDQVRRVARADMNTTSAVMREWRRQQTAQAAAELAAVQGELTQAVTRAERAEAIAEEIEHRAADLRAELDRAHQDADRSRNTATEAQQATKAVTMQLEQVRAGLVKVQAKAEAAEQSHQEQRKKAATEIHKMAERLSAVQAERDQARQNAGGARERAAELAGQLTAHQEQATALLARLAPAEAQDNPGC